MGWPNWVPVPLARRLRSTPTGPAPVAESRVPAASWLCTTSVAAKALTRPSMVVESVQRVPGSTPWGGRGGESSCSSARHHARRPIAPATASSAGPSGAATSAALR